MIAKQWRKRLNYLAISLFVVWHTIAMVVGPSPDSVISRSFRALWAPYLTYFRLESSWSFFAPEIGLQSQIRYVIEDADGNEHTFVPTIALNQFHPKYRWFKLVYEGVFIEHSEIFGEAPVALLCRKHASLRPVSITVFQVQQERDFWPEDQLSGKHPLDPEFATMYRLQAAACPGELVRSPSKE
jgi:hypothetical protein